MSKFRQTTRYLDAASALFSKTPNLWPKNGLDPSSYVELLTEMGYGRPLINTFYLAGVRTVGTLFFSALAGFAFAKRDFPGRNKFFFAMLATMMLPRQITLIPWYLLMTQVFKWTDTY